MSRNPTVVTLPPFTGLTRRFVLITASIYLGALLLSMVAYEGTAWAVDHLMLHPTQALGLFPTQLVTYSFISLDLLGTLFSCLMLWFFGSALEGERGRRWFGEYFLASTIGGAVLACLLSRTVLSRLPDFGTTVRTSGLWPALLALIVAFAWFNPEQELSFNFLFRVKAKYLAAIYMLVYLALALSSGQRFEALTSLCAGLAGYGYLRLAPRQGLRFLASERWYGMRNAFYRNKRKQAAKKFTVYMKQQGKDVHFDAEGKYVSLDDEKRDPNDKRWMN